MQIYTRTGDKGYTSVVGGMKLAKDAERVIAYGTVDELNSVVGMAASVDGISSDLKEELMTIQQYLFDCGNDLATPHGKNPYRVDEELTLWLESRIDEYAAIPPTVESFILPGGTQLASVLHFARTVARRAEREIVSFQWTNDMNGEVLKFINRLSDYFFAIARVANAEENVKDVLYERSGRVFHTEITKADLKD
ncbi:cob(I)yrinic acid a,c-diamide adenosyltransferase [Jeotgalibaca sp. MA1X17-3]|uniref:cob(I)yrinic acid a,c-diamide adenosyltransferase n=1 Tax=Jeotgalibaca sp. MA1X17-3 TaxID=2908211 RepID=UPI001F2685D3|nr:cob(I)yrinic acid a,c-diamide adenosyltransferase [Jeotgalibaca sp. MA1X17-3]UJF15322.1 cob(I)yrinic acid a,c-diamide adenosyltransferase [Jeotgalibaca sp. MA1X17-3]